MSTVKKIAANTSFILLGNIIVKVLALFISVYLARYLGVEDFGEYNFVLTYLMFFSFIASFGLDSILIRDAPRSHLNIETLTANIFFIRLTTSVFSICLSILLINLLNYPHQTSLYVSLMSIILLFQGISYLFESVFQAKFKMQYSAISQIVSKLFYTLMIFILIYLKKNLLWFFIIYIVSEIVRTLIATFYSHKFIRLKCSIDLDVCKYLLKECLPFVVGYALFIIYYRIDIIMLSKMQGNIAVGLYSAAYKITDPLLFIPGALSSTMMPIMSKEYKDSSSGLKQLYDLGSKYILQLMLPITVGIFLLSDRVVDLLYTNSYFPSVITLQILSLTILFNSLNSIQSSLLTASDRQKMNTISVGICCILNILLNYIMIPLYSYNGAAIATLISVIVLFFIEFIFIRKSLHLAVFKKDSYKVVLSSFFMGLLTYYIVNLNILVIIGTSALFYGLILLITKSFSKEDFLLMKSIFKKN